MSETKDNHEPGDCEECPESIWPMCPEHMAIEIDELRVQLAKVTAERDDLRDRLLCACSYGVGEHGENERDIARLLGIPRHELPALLADALNVNWVCRERATSTEGVTE